MKDEAEQALCPEQLLGKGLESSKAFPLHLASQTAMGQLDEYFRGNEDDLPLLATRFQQSGPDTWIGLFYPASRCRGSRPAAHRRRIAGRDC